MADGARRFFQALRSPAGDEMILTKNLFVETILPASILRTLEADEMAEYRRPFEQPGEGRRPTLTWPREIPIDGEPADVTAIVQAYADWLVTSDVPKLFVNAEPGSILVGAQREFCRTWPNQTEVTVAGNHFVQEDSADADRPGARRVARDVRLRPRCTTRRRSARHRSSCRAPTLDPTVEFFVDRLGFRLDAIFPADDPSVAVLSGHGVTVRLDGSVDGGAGTSPAAVRRRGGRHATSSRRTAPSSRSSPPIRRSWCHQWSRSWWSTVCTTARAWIVGRAGMRYRDLIPGRLGGSFIASHIHIPDAGPVPDYVHFHHVRFQMIFCAKGWVRLVYEDQGEPFVLEAGDCVLQPPRIRHRVLECSADLEVVEIGCPAEHETIVEHTIELPTAELRPDREFTGQRFTRHRASQAVWQAVAPERIRTTRPRDRRRDREVWRVHGSCDRPASRRATGSRTTPSSSSCSCSAARPRSTPTRTRTAYRSGTVTRCRSRVPSAGRCSTAVPIWSCSTSRSPRT